MPISLTCKCGRHFEVLEENAGDRVPCPHCGQWLKVPDPKPKLPPDEEFLPWEPGPTATFLKSSIHPRVLGALLTRNGNEEISPEDF